MDTKLNFWISSDVAVTSRVVTFAILDLCIPGEGTDVLSRIVRRAVTAVSFLPFFSRFGFSTFASLVLNYCSEPVRRRAVITAIFLFRALEPSRSPTRHSILTSAVRVPAVCAEITVYLFVLSPVHSAQCKLTDRGTPITAKYLFSSSCRFEPRSSTLLRVFHLPVHRRTEKITPPSCGSSDKFRHIKSYTSYINYSFVKISLLNFYYSWLLFSADRCVNVIVSCH